MWYPCKEFKNNKNNNQFKSLVWFIIDSLDKKQKLNGYALKNVERILTLCKVTCVRWEKKIVFEAKVEDDVKRFEEIGHKWWKAAMFDHENEEELLML